MTARSRDVVPVPAELAGSSPYVRRAMLLRPMPSHRPAALRSRLRISALACTAIAGVRALASARDDHEGEAVTNGERWTTERARAWAASRGWRVGCNFTPSSASNQLEMWRAETFDLETIDRELGWAASLGFTSMRVFLHDLLWEHDRDGFVERIDRYLATADAHGIGALFVFFDGVWGPAPQWGAQPEPRPRVHNSRWVQSPGRAVLGDPTRHDSLAPYVQGVLERFRDDARIDGWDLFNEPDNPNPAYRDDEMPPDEKAERALELTRHAFAWAREANPSQPLTVGSRLQEALDTGHDQGRTAWRYARGRGHTGVRRSRRGQLLQCAQTFGVDFVVQ